NLRMTLTDHVLADYYRCPAYLTDFTLSGELPETPGYFRLGQNILCYGRLSSGHAARPPVEDLHDAIKSVDPSGAGPRLPFDAGQVMETLRRERYAAGFHGDGHILTEALRKAYYLVRPLLPVPIRKIAQKIHLTGWDRIRFPAWPVDGTV